ncbi:MAG: cytochrome c [Dehalococcoidia bacterium]|nr:cytochrome c [Dehalococcoidia bacterium]
MRPTPRPPTETPVPPTPTPPPPAGNFQSGRQVFVTVGCSTCHRADGTGLVGPRIANTNLSFAEVLGQLRSPREGMPPFGPETVSDQQVRDIYAFLKSLP